MASMLLLLLPLELPEQHSCIHSRISSTGPEENAGPAAAADDDAGDDDAAVHCTSL